MGLRELLILILILAIVGVILRGLYVALRARRGQLRMQLDKNIPQYDPEELVLSELPNGGARMVERSFAQVVQQNSEFSTNERRKFGKADHAIPVLMDTIGDDDDDEGVSAPRQSSVASARDAARQKHLLGQRHAPITQKPVHRPIDRMAAMAQNAPSVSPPESLQDPEDFDDEQYDDPLDNHVFSEPAYEEGFDEATEEDLEDFDDEEEASDIRLDADDAYDDGEDYDDDLDDDDLDDDDGLDDEASEEDDPDFDHDEDDEEDDDEFDDEQNEDEDYDEPDSWDDEDDAEDAEVSTRAEEFDDVYGDLDEEPPRNSHQEQEYDVDQDDDDGWDDEVEQVPAARTSAPRRWLKWAGDKLSGMSASSEEPVRERNFHGNDRAEPVLGLEGFDDDLPVAPAPKPASRPASKPVSKEPLDKSRQAQLSFDDDEEEEDFGHEEAAEESYYEEPVQAPVQEKPRQPKSKAAEPAVPPDYSEVLVINVVAKPDREFYGVDLLQALLAAGLRFGDMSIFHRHIDQNPKSPVLFSVANMVNPGTFDLNQINDFETRGVCFFMTLPNVANSMQAFDRMLDAAQQIRIALDGDLKDDNRSVMTAQTIEHYRQRVRDFDLRQLRQPK